MSDNLEISDILIVGGGTAGLMCAANIDEQFNTIVIEKCPEIGNKLKISGSGQCNMTHSGDIDSFIKAYGDNGRFLKKALYCFSNKDLINYFNKLNISIIEREDGKIFPASLNSRDVIEALKNEIIKKKHKILTKASVKSVSRDIISGNFTVKTDDRTFVSRIIVISTGGRSYPRTGSSGDGYSFAQSMGHRIVKTTPALVPLIIPEWSFADLSGNSFSNATITLKRGSSKISRSGELLITHKGISGPLVLDFSRYLEQNDKVTINFFSDFNAETLIAELTELFASKPSSKIDNILPKTGLPQNFCSTVIRLAGVEAVSTCSSVSKIHVRRISELICLYHTTVIKDSYDNAMVTKGGVDLNEIYSATMSSKLIEGLYFCGEVLDIDGDTGGYNIQAAFSTAFSAADAINKTLAQRN